MSSIDPRGRRTSYVLGIVALFFAFNSFAQSSPTADVRLVTTLRDVFNRALEANPNLRGQRFAVTAAEARIDQAALRPVFEIGVEAENILGTNRLSTFDDSEITLRLGTVLELGGKRGRRIDSARSERDLILTQNDAERLDLLAEVARRFIRVATAQEDVDLAKRRLDLADRTRKGVDQRVSAARSPRLESNNAAVAANRAEIEYQQAESVLRQSWAQLSSLWGGETAYSGRVAADLFAMPSTGDYAALTALLDRNPDIIRFASERRIQDARLRLAESQRTPDVTLSAGIRRLQADRSNAFVLSASIPLGSSSRAAPYIAEAQSLRGGLQYKEQAVRSELMATLFVALEQLAQSRQEVQKLLTVAIPQADEANKLALEGYNVGRFSLLELITAQQQLTDLQRQAIDAAASFHESLLEVERLTGTSAADRDLSNNAGKP
jgi:cobalt-zinc-cadmium efflux system outer membrane protein